MEGTTEKDCSPLWGLYQQIVSDMKTCWIFKLIPINSAIIIVARAFGGLSYGGAYLVVPLYVRETSQDNMKGFFMTIVMSNQYTGLLIMYATGSYLSYYTTQWILLAISIVTFILMLFIPEPPVFLVKQGKFEMAAKTLAKLRGLSADDVIVANEMNYMKEQDEKFKSVESISAKSILKNKAWFRGLVIIQLLAFCVAGNGSFGIMTYAWSIMQQAGVSISPELLTLIVPVLLMLGATIPVVVVERAGRKFPLAGAFITSAISMGSMASALLAQRYEATVPVWVFVLCIAGAVASYSAGIVCLPSIIMTEIFRFQNSAPMWEEFISKATKLHSALKSALSAIASFLDAFQKIADAATNARGATKEIGTALTRVCLRHRAIETRMKTFISALMDTLITPLSERADEWRRGACSSTGALSREHARECKRARAELRRRVHDAQRHARKARRAPSDAKRRADVCIQDVQERKQQLEEMEEKAVKAALIEERSRFCHFVSLLNPVVECEVAMLAEVGHLQEGSEQLIRHTAEPRTLPAASLQVICDVKSCYSGWAEGSPPASRLGSRKSSLTSISSLTSACSDSLGVTGSNANCSTPISNATMVATLGAAQESDRLCLSQPGARLACAGSADSGFRSQDALQRRNLYSHDESDTQSISSECLAHTERDVHNAASATWPDLKDTAQFERAASAIMGGRPHTISAAYSRQQPRAGLSARTFASERDVQRADTGACARPPLPTRCSSLERPAVPAKTTNANTGQQEFKPTKPSSLPPHLTKEMPAALYVNMSELATLAASRAQQHHNAEQPHQEKVCSESSASESSLESSSGYGSQGAFAAEDHALQHQAQHADVDTEIVTLRRDSDASVAAARESFSISLGCLEEAVRSLDEASETPAFATIGKKPAVPKRRPVSMTATVWSRRGSSSSLGKPPPPVRRSSSISRPQRPPFAQGNNQSPQMSTDVDNLPPPPAFLLQPDNESNPAHPGINVAETVKQLTELKHMPASPSLVRRSLQQIQNTPSPQPALSTFQQAKSNFSSNTSLNSTGNLNPIYGQTGHRIMAFENSVYVRKNSLNSSNSDLFREANAGSPHGSSPSTPSYGENNSFSSFGPRVSNDSHYGQTGFKMQQDKKYQSNTIYATPSQLGSNASPLALRRNIAARSHSADRHHQEQGGLIASLSAKLAPQLSPRTTRRAISAITAADSPPKSKGIMPTAVQPAFLDKLSATIQQQRRQLDSTRASSVRDMINAHAQPDPRVCHTSLMEQIKRGATLRRNKHCNDRSAPKIR